MSKDDIKGKKSLDSFFKKLIRDKVILSNILNEFITELNDKDPEFISRCLKVGEDGRTVISRDPEIISDNLGSVYLDNVFDLEIPGKDPIRLILNLEGQGDPNPGYPLEARMMNYASALLFQQKGREFTNSDYDKLRKVYSIWIILEPLKEQRNTVLRYKMKGSFDSDNISYPIPSCDYMEIVKVCIGRPDTDSPTKALKVLTAIFTSGLNDWERIERLKRYNIEVDRYLSEEMRGISMTIDDERIEYHTRLGYEAGIEEGIEEGIKVGMEKGREIGKKESDEQMVDHFAFHISELIKNEGLTLEEAIAKVYVPDFLIDDVKNRFE